VANSAERIELDAEGNYLRAGSVAAERTSETRPMLGFILYLILVGIVAGYLARLLVPGRDPMSFVQTVLLGIVGSFIGGFLGYLIFNEDFDDGAFQPAGFFGSIIGAVIALLIYRAVVSRNGTARRLPGDSGTF
jgi:uncharacterized membrane protein YeaQ/YmgE (transglycosylase-associated protein family)